MLSAQQAGLVVPKTSRWRSLRHALTSVRHDPYQASHIYRPNASRCLFELHASRKSRKDSIDLTLDEIEGGVSQKNRDWHTTSQDLIRALGDIGREYATPTELAGKLDLSYTSALRVTTDREGAVQEIAAAKQASEAPHTVPQRKQQRHLKDILVRYLEHVEPQLNMRRTKEIPSSSLDQALAKTFNHSVRKWLRKRDWDVEDLMDWTWILKSASADLATARFKCIAHNGDGTRLRIPNTIFLFLLRRRNMSSRGLNSLLQYAWLAMDLMSINVQTNGGMTVAETEPSQHIATKSVLSPKEDPAGMTEDMFILMIIRLLRHAQRAWPAANETIINLFCRYVNGLNFHMDPSVDPARLAFIYNTMLSLLSGPSSLEPYVSTMYQQRAQFTILHRMNDFNPPLVVDKRGYRAFTKIQLMHKKTLREREWAMLKSRSWPPWKEDKMGVHSVIGPKSGISRASQSLRDAEEAGYGAGAWQASASLIAGWDIDGSPTIQTRRAAVWNDGGHNPQDQNAIVWASRIRATRSLREAWAMFQGFKDARSIPLGACSEVYLAVFEKITAKVERSEGLEHSLSAQSHLPGDGLETFPDPHINAVYVRTSPPTFEHFYDILVADGVRRKGRLLNFLVAHAPSLKFVTSIIAASDLPLTYKQGLLSDVNSAKSAERQSILQEIPRALFEAFIVSTAKFGARTELRDEDEQTEACAKLEISEDLFSHPFSYALDLLISRRHPHPRPWNALLKSIANGRISDIKGHSMQTSYQRSAFNTWDFCLQLLQHMENFHINIDLDAIHEVCRTFERAVISAQQSIDSDTGSADSRKDVAATLIETGLSKIKMHFKRAVTADENQQEIPFHLRCEKVEVDQALEAEVNHTAQDADSQDQTHDYDEAQDETRVFDNPDASKRAFLPPGCLLPRLLAIPRPAFLHQMIRCLGLARDYPGLLDLVEWMALFANELKMQADEQRNGAKMTRRCIVAARVVLERSWETIDETHPHVESEVAEQDTVERNFSAHSPPGAGAQMDEPDGGGKPFTRAAASKEVRGIVKGVIESNPSWGGWPSDQEVREYVSKGVFA